MKSHFLRLFEYDAAMNRIMLGLLKDPSVFSYTINPTIPTNPVAASTLALMAHLLTSQGVWLLRCQGKSSLGIDLAPRGKTPEDLATEIDRLQLEWISFLTEESDFERTFTYTDQSGKNTYTNLLRDVLTHVINHGTHHRAQIGQQLKAAGLEKLSPTDYIIYLRMTGK